MSVYVGEDHRRLGVARGLYRSLFAVLRLQGIVGVCAGIVPGNDTSIRLHREFGFRQVGTSEAVGYKFGRWHDVGFWQLDFGPRPAAPPPPLTLSEARALPSFAASLAAGEVSPQRA